MTRWFIHSLITNSLSVLIETQFANSCRDSLILSSICAPIFHLLTPWATSLSFIHPLTYLFITHSPFDILPYTPSHPLIDSIINSSYMYARMHLVKWTCQLIINLLTRVHTQHFHQYVFLCLLKASFIHELTASSSHSPSMQFVIPQRSITRALWARHNGQCRGQGGYDP